MIDGGCAVIKSEAGHMHDRDVGRSRGYGTRCSDMKKVLYPWCAGYRT